MDKKLKTEPEHQAASEAPAGSLARLRSLIGERLPLLMVAGIVAAAALVAIWFVNRSGDLPGVDPVVCYCRSTDKSLAAAFYFSGFVY